MDAPLAHSISSTGLQQQQHQRRTLLMRTLRFAMQALSAEVVDCDRLFASGSVCAVGRAPQNSNVTDKILVSSAKNNFVSCLEGFKSITCEKKKAVQELLENEVLSGR